MKFILRYCILVLALSVFVTDPTAHAQDTPTPTPTATATPVNRVWTLDEVLNEEQPGPVIPPINYCQNNGRFKPCVCTQDVSRDMRYRPALKECGGRAAVILSGRYSSVYSVVVRDTENRDRWPVTGFGGCTNYQALTLGLNKCSAFKVQKKVFAGTAGHPVAAYCLGASGYSKLFKRVVRVTAKLSDDPTSNKDPLVRWCLKRPDEPLN